jgi:multiple sugar transport system ATP-binding protein
MSFGLKIRKYPKEEIQTRVHEAAQILNIEELLQRKPRALSGGQRQRVAVGRAIVRKPKVFLFDEPLSNLDAKLRVQMRAEISSLHTRLQATMVYVTHDQVEAMTMGDRIVVLRDGVTQQIGTPLELYNNPKNRFVAGFIGSPPMNIMSAAVKEKGNKIITDEGDFQIAFSGQTADLLRPYIGKNVLLGIRPEDLVYTPTPDKQNNISTTIEVVEPLGSEIHLYVSTKTHQLIVRVPPRWEFTVGNEANFIPDINKVKFFDINTEEAMK